MKIGKRDFDLKNAYIMGILNVTPDSFSDGGRYDALDRALFHVEEMLRDGMDLLDIGGESTRPGFAPVPAEEELRRVIPVIEAVRRRFPVPISLDTSKAAVAEAGISAGADLINDITGLRGDPQMAPLLARKGLPCVLMRNGACSGAEEALAQMAQLIREAKAAGISGERIILDPGIGFAGGCAQDLALLRSLDRMAGEYPLLLGTSRKSVIGMTLDLPAEERLEGTLATTVLGAVRGVTFFRVHDVKENARALRMTMAVLKGD